MTRHSHRRAKPTARYGLAWRVVGLLPGYIILGLELPLLLSPILGGCPFIEPMERRRTERLKLAIPLSVSVLNSSAPGHGTESVNVSAGGMYFATKLPVSRGTGVQLLFKMPEEVTHSAASDWVCMGHVVHVKPVSAPDGWLGVGVQFDCYEIVPTTDKSVDGFDPFVNGELGP